MGLPPSFGVRKAGSARLRAVLEAAGIGRKEEPRVGKLVLAVTPRQAVKKGRRAPVGVPGKEWVSGVGKPRLKGAKAGLVPPPVSPRL